MRVGKVVFVNKKKAPASCSTECFSCRGRRGGGVFHSCGRRESGEQRRGAQVSVYLAALAHTHTSTLVLVPAENSRTDDSARCFHCRITTQLRSREIRSSLSVFMTRTVGDLICF
ncbi:hypothetical protein JOB18_043640 [Solea senegalensis]|uniref:Uncharacterized protein n=1 Tax=Solea senegalensis TaxID=28829 RepID=A0AAV6SVV9_SOLSE|nr:hypothetical protein JOB18_043640 [Solea senegalensis]